MPELRIVTFKEAMEMPDGTFFCCEEVEQGCWSSMILRKQTIEDYLTDEDAYAEKLSMIPALIEPQEGDAIYDGPYSYSNPPADLRLIVIPCHEKEK